MIDICWTMTTIPNEIKQHMEFLSIELIKVEDDDELLDLINIYPVNCSFTSKVYYKTIPPPVCLKNGTYDMLWFDDIVFLAIYYIDTHPDDSMYQKLIEECGLLDSCDYKMEDVIQLFVIMVGNRYYYKFSKRMVSPSHKEWLPILLDYKNEDTNCIDDDDDNSDDDDDDNSDYEYLTDEDVKFKISKWSYRKLNDIAICQKNENIGDCKANQHKDSASYKPISNYYYAKIHSTVSNYWLKANYCDSDGIDTHYLYSDGSFTSTEDITKGMTQYDEILIFGDGITIPLKLYRTRYRACCEPVFFVRDNVNYVMINTELCKMSIYELPSGKLYTTVSCPEIMVTVRRHADNNQHYIAYGWMWGPYEQTNTINMDNVFYNTPNTT